MGIFDTFADGPNQIKREGQEITIRFQRTGPSTGRISWNIPAPAAGCNSNTQAYNGIVITVNNKPSNYLSTSPTNGTYYTGDATVDGDMHAGDSIDGALVLGAFYDDKTTTFIDVNDVQDKTPYYISGYAVDAQCRYHREGVHAYSLPTGVDEWHMPDKAAMHNVMIDVQGGITTSALTGLEADKTYPLTFRIQGKEYTINVEGQNSTSYGDLLHEMNEQMALLGDVYSSPIAPFANTLHYVPGERTVGMWNGYNYKNIPVLVHSQDPTDVPSPKYWVQPLENGFILREKDVNTTLWDIVTTDKYISSSIDLNGLFNPSSNQTGIECNQLWLDISDPINKVVWLFKNSHWEKLYTYNGDRNPVLPPIMGCDSYWFNTSTGVVSNWNVDNKSWSSVDVIYHPTDPNTLADGVYWFDESVNKLKTKNSSTWNIVPNVEVVSDSSNINIDELSKYASYATNFVYLLDEQKLFNISHVWNNITIVIQDTQPSSSNVGTYWYSEIDGAVRKLGVSGWDSLDSVAFMSGFDTNTPLSVLTTKPDFVFDTINNQFFELSKSSSEYLVLSFDKNPLDRTLTKLWWDASGDKLNVWADERNAWVVVTQFIQSPTDPSLALPVKDNSAWVNSNNEVRLIFSNVCKRTNNVIIFGGSPGNITNGQLWHNPTTNLWYAWDSINNVFLQIEPIVYPYDINDFTQGILDYEFWYDTVSGSLKLMDDATKDWFIVEYMTKPVKNVIGQYWYDTNLDRMLRWNGADWEESIGLAAVEFILAENRTARSTLSFFTRDAGCANSIEIINTPDDILSSLSNNVIYLEPETGASGLSSGPMYNQLGVGDDGSPDERRKIHDDIRTMLGHPIVVVELTKEQIDICIDLALQELRKHSSFSVNRGVFFLDLKPNQQKYILANKCVGFNKVTNINSIHRARGYGAGALAMDNDVFSAAALQRLYTMGTFDILSYYLVSAYMEELETLFANKIMFNWIESTRELSLFSGIYRNERVLIDAFFERTEQDLMVDRQTSVWIKRWALAEAKLILATGARGKFQSLPGPNGNTTLNASDLQQQAKDEMDRLREQLEDHSMQNLTGLGVRAHFIMG